MFFHPWYFCSCIQLELDCNNNNFIWFKFIKLAEVSQSWEGRRSFQDIVKGPRPLIQHHSLEMTSLLRPTVGVSCPNKAPFINIIIIFSTNDFKQLCEKCLLYETRITSSCSALLSLLKTVALVLLSSTLVNFTLLSNGPIKTVQVPKFKDNYIYLFISPLFFLKRTKCMLCC